MHVLVLRRGLKDYVDRTIANSCLGVDCYEFPNNFSSETLNQSVKKEYDAIIIAISENRFLERALIQLSKYHVKNLFVVRLFCIDKKQDFLSEFTISNGVISYNHSLLDRVLNPDAYLVHLETHVIDHCNFNCKACNNFAPFVKIPHSTDVSMFENDINRLNKMYSQIGRFFLLGGEPLLAPDLSCEMIRIYRKYFPAGELRLLTNASLILRMEEAFWNTLRENDVIIHITLYPPIKRIINEIEECLNDKGIPYHIFREAKTFLKHWTYFPFEDADYNNVHCGSAGCHYLRDGKIYKCPDAFLIGNIGKNGKNLITQDEIDIYKSNGKDIIEKASEPIDLCHSCTFKRATEIEWESVGDQVDEKDWFLKNRFEAENDALINKLNDVSREKDALEVELKQSIAHYKDDYNRVKGSFSYKLGLCITYIPRRIVHFFV